MGLVCCDIDGTLVRDDGTLFAGVASFATALVAGDWVVALCTSRSSRAAQELARLIPEVQYIASLSGFQIARRHTQGQWHTVIETPGFTPTQKVEIVEVILGYGLELWAYTPSDWLVSRLTPKTIEESRATGETPVQLSIDDFAREPVLKFVAPCIEPAVLPVQRRQLEGAGAACRLSGSCQLEISPATISDKGCRLLRQYVGASLVVAFGDSENDIGMFAAADCSFTFADSADGVRTAASQILVSNRTDAYSQLLRSLAKGAN